MIYRIILKLFFYFSSTQGAQWAADGGGGGQEGDGIHLDPRRGVDHLHRRHGPGFPATSGSRAACTVFFLKCGKMEGELGSSM